MKQRILQRTFQIIVRILLKILSSTVFTGQGLVFLISRIGSGLHTLLSLTVPAVLFLYLKGRQVRALIVHLIIPLKGHALYLFGHRYFVHAFVVLIVFFVATPSLFAADASPGIFGRTTLLSAIAQGDEQEDLIIDDTIPAHDLDSILEARFQDRPPQPPAHEAPLPLSLDGGAVVGQELPGVITPITRTEIVQYEVQPGDTVWHVAEQFGVSITTILWENKLTLYSTIRPGQKLMVLPVSGTTHTVQKKETLEQIAKKYNASLEEIQQYNKVALEQIAPGLKLIIPGGRPYVAPAPVQPRRPIASAPSSAVKRAGEKLLWPTDGRRITQYFRWRHAGIDIGESVGSAIYASGGGVIEFSGWGRGGWGNTVVIDHGSGLKTRYSHASKVLVQRGEAVQKGQVVALIGSTGRSSGPHVDFRVYINGRTANPLEYIR